MRKTALFAFAFIFWATTAIAMTGAEFMAMNSFDRWRSLQPTVAYYVDLGYKNVPNGAELEDAMEKMIRQLGLGRKNADKIALDAAKALGMTK